LSAGSAAVLVESFFGGFVAITVLALGWAAWRFRGRGHTEAWAVSLAFSTVATAPGVVLLVEWCVRWAAHRYWPGAMELSLSTWTQWFCWLGGLVMSPMLFVSAFLMRAEATPAHVYALQLTQLVAWGWAIPVTFLVTI
jgi:hypothetical protein